MLKDLSLKAAAVILTIFLGGCAAVSIPGYIHDEHPYTREFGAGYKTVLDATTFLLSDFGWRVERASAPDVFERPKDPRKYQGDAVLLFTDTRLIGLFFGSRYVRLNVYVRAMGETKTEVEIRYVTVTSTLFKSYEHYRNDRFVDRFFDHIQQEIDRKKPQ